MLSIAPAIPPILTSDLTACLGNRSEAMVKTLVAQAWCTATARLSKPTATHTLEANWARMTEISKMANNNRADFLAFNVGQPLLINQEEKYPPPILPTVVAV